MIRSLRLSLLLFPGLLSGIFLYAHGDLHERIEQVTYEIKANRDSAYLYVKRGELYNQHGAYKKALRDFKKAGDHHYPDQHRLLYETALALDRLGRQAQAITHLNTILEADAAAVKASRLKGQILLSEGQYEEAAHALEAVITYAEETIPDNYIEAADAWERTMNADALMRADSVLQEGIAALGPLRTFYDRLIELYRKAGDFPVVIRYQTRILEQSDRKEWMLHARARTYMEMGDVTHARKDLELALQTINSLPARLQSQKNILGLREQILADLSTLTD